MVDERDTKEVEPSGHIQPVVIPDGSYPVDPLPREIALDVFVQRKKHRVKLNFESQPLVVGRGDEESPVAVDMTPFEASEQGVSRAHAHFTKNESGIFVEDAGSTNGTRINGAALENERPYRLRNGDEIEFGTLRTVIRFIR